MRTNKRVGAIVIREDRILLIHRFKNGQEYWVLPGGGVEDDETLEEALVREVMEETSLNLLSCEILDMCEIDNCQHYLYRCELSEGTPEIGGPEKSNSNENNIYILEWVSAKKVFEMNNLYPIFLKKCLVELNL